MMKIQSCIPYDDNTATILLDNGTVIRIRVGTHLLNNKLRIEAIAISKDGDELVCGAI